MSTDGIRFIPMARERVAHIDFIALGRERRMMTGLLSLDVTRARQRLRDNKRAQQTPTSLTAFLIATVAQAVSRHPEVQAVLAPGHRLAVFDGVDVATLVEVDLGSGPFPLAHVLRGADQRSVADIEAEIRRVQSDPQVAAQPWKQRGAELFFRLPGPARRLLMRWLFRSPRRLRQMTGTLTLSSVGMFGQGEAWGIGVPTVHSLTVIVGGLTESDAGQARLSVTVSCDHDVVDGAPMARFIEDLRRTARRGEL